MEIEWRDESIPPYIRLLCYRPNGMDYHYECWKVIDTQVSQLTISDGANDGCGLVVVDVKDRAHAERIIRAIEGEE